MSGEVMNNPTREAAIDDEVEANENKLKDRKVSWAKLRRIDSLNLEAGRISTAGGDTSGVCSCPPSISFLFFFFFTVFERETRIYVIYEIICVLNR